MRHWQHTVSSRISPRHCQCVLKRVGNWSYSKQILIPNWRRYDNSTWGAVLGEVNAILQQTNHKSWGLVSSDFAGSQAGYAVNKLKEAWDNGILDNSGVEKYINKLNDAFAGIAIFNYDPTTKYVGRVLMIEEVVKVGSRKKK